MRNSNNTSKRLEHKQLSQTHPTTYTPAISFSVPVVIGNDYAIYLGNTWTSSSFTSEEWIRVEGIDSFLSTGYLKTTTYCKTFNGLFNLLNHSILANVVKNVQLCQSNELTGEFDINRKYVIVELHATEFADDFKTRFIGINGKRIKDLCNSLDCKITLE